MEKGESVSQSSSSDDEKQPQTTTSLLYAPKPQKKKKNRDRKAVFLPMKVFREPANENTPAAPSKYRKMRTARLVLFDNCKINSLMPPQFPIPIREDVTQSNKAKNLDIRSFIKESEKLKPRAFDIIKRGSLSGLKLSAICI